MSISRPFAISPEGAGIAGTSIVGNVAAGTPTAGFAATGLKWWNGPDETNGYIIAGENGAGTIAPDGTTANIQFWRSSAITDNAFKALAESVLGTGFGNITAAYDAVIAAGMWTNFLPPLPDIVINGNTSVSPSLQNTSGTIVVNTAGSTITYRTYAGYGVGADTTTNLSITGLSGYTSTQNAAGPGNHTDQVITFTETGTFNWNLNLTNYTISSGSGGSIALN
jgi:hypothetical protein